MLLDSKGVKKSSIPGVAGSVGLSSLESSCDADADAMVGFVREGYICSLKRDEISGFIASG